MQIGSKAYNGAYYGGNGRIVVPQQSGQEAMQSVTQQSRVGGSQNVVLASKNDSSLRTPSAALASAMWQMMVRRSDDNTGRLIV